MFPFYNTSHSNEWLSGFCRAWCQHIHLNQVCWSIGPVLEYLYIHTYIYIYIYIDLGYILDSYCYTVTVKKWCTCFCQVAVALGAKIACSAGYWLTNSSATDHKTHSLDQSVVQLRIWTFFGSAEQKDTLNVTLLSIYLNIINNKAISAIVCGRLFKFFRSLIIHECHCFIFILPTCFLQSIPDWFMEIKYPWCINITFLGDSTCSRCWSVHKNDMHVWPITV